MTKKKIFQKKIGKFKKEVEEKMSKSSFTINQFISSVIIKVYFAEKDLKELNILLAMNPLLSHELVLSPGRICQKGYHETSVTETSNKN